MIYISLLVPYLLISAILWLRIGFLNKWINFDQFGYNKVIWIRMLQRFNLTINFTLISLILSVIVNAFYILITKLIFDYEILVLIVLNGLLPLSLIILPFLIYKSINKAIHKWLITKFILNPVYNVILLPILIFLTYLVFETMLS